MAPASPGDEPSHEPSHEPDIDARHGMLDVMELGAITRRMSAQRSAAQRTVAVGIVLLAIGVVTVAALDVAGAETPGAIVHLTISQVGLTPLAPIFEAAVLIVAAGSAAVLVVAIHRRRHRRAQAVLGGVAGGIAVIGLVLVAAFTKQDWSQPPSLSGTVHRAGSLAAFVALPIAVIVLARHARTARRLAVAAVVAALAGLASFVPIVVAIVVFGQAGRWWLQVPLGLVERAIAVGDVTGLFLLAALSARELRRSADDHAEAGGALDGATPTSTVEDESVRTPARS